MCAAKISDQQDSDSYDNTGTESIIRGIISRQCHSTLVHRYQFRAHRQMQDILIVFAHSYTYDGAELIKRRTILQHKGTLVQQYGYRVHRRTQDILITFAHSYNTISAELLNRPKTSLHRDSTLFQLERFGAFQQTQRKTYPWKRIFGLLTLDWAMRAIAKVATFSTSEAAEIHEASELPECLPTQCPQHRKFTHRAVRICGAMVIDGTSACVSRQRAASNCQSGGLLYFRSNGNSGIIEDRLSGGPLDFRRPKNSGTQNSLSETWKEKNTWVNLEQRMTLFHIGCASQMQHAIRYITETWHIGESCMKSGVGISVWSFGDEIHSNHRNLQMTTSVDRQTWRIFCRSPLQSATVESSVEDVFATQHKLQRWRRLFFAWKTKVKDTSSKIETICLCINAHFKGLAWQKRFFIDSMLTSKMNFKGRNDLLCFTR